MNIKDVDTIPTIIGDRLVAIFERQASLHEKYKTIEIENQTGYGYIWNLGFHIDDCRSQSYIKDLTWRVVEELAEASEAFLADRYTHGQEEIADAFHFLVELCLVLKIEPDFIQKWGAIKRNGPDRLELLFQWVYQRRTHNEFQRGELSYLMWSITEQLGLACNCLKNKPWKQTQMETDVKWMNKHIREAFLEFIRLCAFVGMGADELFEIYFKKSEVNKFRIRSEY